MAEHCYAVSFMLSVSYAESHFQAFYADCRYTECRGGAAAALSITSCFHKTLWWIDFIKYWDDFEGGLIFDKNMAPQQKNK